MKNKNRFIPGLIYIKKEEFRFNTCILNLKIITERKYKILELTVWAKSHLLEHDYRVGVYIGPIEVEFKNFEIDLNYMRLKKLNEI